MAHLHEVKDSDTHFIINPVTMAISNAQNEKNKLQQGDHNSEIFTFQIPKEVEGHDMSLCDVVRVHYINTSTSKADISKDIHKVVDMAVAEDDAETLVFTWLIHGNATKYNGSLTFRILFACTDENDNYTYKKWTEIYKGISIGEGFENEETVLEAQADILKQEFDELEKQMEELTKELFNQLKEDLNDLKENGIGGGTITASEALKNILQRIQTEIKACIRDDSVCPNSYIDETDNLINNIGTGSGEGGGTDEPVDPNPPIEEPDDPVVPDTGWTYDPSKWVSGWTLDNYGQKPVANNATYARVYGYDTDDYYIPIPEGSTKVIFSTTSGVNFNGQMYEFKEDKSYYQRGLSTGKQEHTFVFKGGATSKYIALGINYASGTVPNESLQITFE